jgi:hypothetical protein
MHPSAGACLGILVLSTAPDLVAQEDQFTEGTRIRVSTGRRDIHIGAIVSITDDSIVNRPGFTGELLT